jgi:hypothetical protein
MRPWRLVLFFAFFLSLAPGGDASSSLTSPPPILLSDDANHFNASYWAGRKGELWFTEWLYWNVFCPSQNFAAIYVLGAWNPGNVGDVGMSLKFALHYNLTCGEVDKEEDLGRVSSWSSSYTKADVLVKQKGAALENRMLALSFDQYRATGSSANGQRLTWNYTLARDAVEPWFMYHPPELTLNVVGWLVWFPRARASGTVQLQDGRLLQLADDCVAYHDHDFGAWESFEFLWAWAQVSTPETSVVLAANQDTSKADKGNTCRVHLKSTGQTIVFDPFSAKIAFSDFVPSSVPLHRYPRKATFASSDPATGATVAIEREVLLSPSIAKSAVVVFEQHSLFNVTVADKNGVTLASLRNQPGFSEWTDKLA